LARAHRISPWVFARRRGDVSFPKGFADDYRTTLGTNLHLLSEGKRVREELARRGIPAGFRKGMALIGAVYADEGERPLVDVDLYVEPSDATAAAEVIASLGYERIHPVLDGSVLLARSAGSLRFLIDCHWDLGFEGRCRPDWRSVIGSPLGSDGTLTPEAFAADLVGHLWHHSFRGLQRYLDFAMLIRSGSVDPAWLKDLGRRLRMGPAVEWILGVLAALWEVPGCAPPTRGPRQLLLRRLVGHPVPRPDGGHSASIATFLAAAPVDVLASALLRKASPRR
jgi:hypothetical protein